MTSVGVSGIGLTFPQQWALLALRHQLDGLGLALGDGQTALLVGLDEGHADVHGPAGPRGQSRHLPRQH